METIIYCVVAFIFLILCFVISVIKNKLKKENSSPQVNNMTLSQSKNNYNNISEDNQYYFLNRNIPHLTLEQKQKILEDAADFENHFVDLSSFLFHLFQKCVENNYIDSAILCVKALEISPTRGLRCYDELQEYFQKEKDIDSCEKYCLKALSFIPDVIWESKTNNIKAVIGYLGAIKRLCIIYKNKKEYSKLATVARLGLTLGLTDGSEGGFLNRYDFARSKTSELYDFTHEIGYDANKIESIIENHGNIETPQSTSVRKRYKYTTKPTKSYTVIDIETTGLSPNWSEIIEISAVKVVNFEVVDRFDSYIHPTNSIPPEATSINGITDEMVKDAPNIAEILPKFLTFIGNDIVVGHNINFDLRFIIRDCYNNKIELKKDFLAIDTLRISKKVFTTLKNHDLPSLKRHLNLNYSSHKSLDDCLTTHELYKQCSAVIHKNVA